MQRIGKIDGKRDQQKRGGVEEKKIRIRQNGLAEIQVGIPLGKLPEPAYFLDETRVRVAVAEDIAIEKHGGRKENLPEERDDAGGEKSHNCKIRSKERWAFGCCRWPDR